MSTAACLVREATVADLPEVITIMQANSSAPQWSEAQLRLMLGTHQSNGAILRLVFVAENNGTVQGFAVVTVLTAGHLADAEMESIAVAPSAQGKGIGRALLQCAIAWALERGADCMRLEVRAANAPALSLYAKAAFLQTGLRRGYYTHPEDDAVLLELKLRPR